MDQEGGYFSPHHLLVAKKKVVSLQVSSLSLYSLFPQHCNSHLATNSNHETKISSCYTKINKNIPNLQLVDTIPPLLILFPTFFSLFPFLPAFLSFSFLSYLSISFFPPPFSFFFFLFFLPHFFILFILPLFLSSIK